MKEITIRLVDDTAEFISNEAKELGLTPEELLKHVVGLYVRSSRRIEHPGSRSIAIGFGNIGGILRSLFEGSDEIVKNFLKARAKEGSLSCRDCTMKITEEDIDKGECGCCHIPLKDALGGGPQ